MKHLVIVLGTPLYLILSILTGKLVYHILIPEVTFVGELSLLVVGGTKPDGAMAVAILIAMILMLIGCAIAHDWWENSL